LDYRNGNYELGSEESSEESSEEMQKGSLSDNLHNEMPFFTS